MQLIIGHFGQLEIGQKAADPLQHLVRLQAIALSVSEFK